MPEHITISEAQETDIPEMITVYCDALEPDILTAFLSGNRRAEAVVKQTQSLTKSLGARFTKPTNRCHIHKAVDTRNGKIAGWSLVRWEDGKFVVPEESPDEDFSKHYLRRVLGAWKEICGGKEHVVLGGLYIAPAYQRQGIGTMLVDHIYGLYDLNKEPVVVQTRAMSESYYEKLGWKTLISVDIDLSVWGGEGKGYGVHRSPQMLRDPEGVLERRRASSS